MSAFGLNSVAWALMLIISIGGAKTGSAHELEFLYIDANEGSASGGHAALRFDREVFHFQHVEPGLLRLFRDDYRAFEFAYGFQENRTIHGHQMAVDDAFFARLREAFTQRLLIQNQHFAALQGLYDDQNLLSQLADINNRRGIPLKGLGYFLSEYHTQAGFDQGTERRENPSPPLVELRQAIENHYGADFLHRKRQQAWQTLQSLQPEHATISSSQLDAENFIATNPHFARRYSNQLLNLAALDVLQDAIPVRRDHLVRASLPALTLQETQRAKLTDFRKRLFTDLVKLLHSQRTDWGFPLLVGMARLHALDDSLASGYLVVLDRRQQQASDQEYRAIDDNTLPAALQYTQQVFASATAQLTKRDALSERDYADLELSATALVQMQHSAQSGNPNVLAHLTSTPSRAANAELVDLPLTENTLAIHKDRVSAEIQTFQDQLTSWYEYQLLGRNCVTEIFRTIDKTVAATANPERQIDLASVSEEILGGYIPESGLHLIPFLAYARVGSEYHVKASHSRLPYREQQRLERYGREQEWLVDLQEASPLSSAIYHWNAADSAFLFFTQDQIWPRPILGSFNLAMAGGQGLFGLFSWPWDGGDNLVKSLKGIFVSVPELLFFNIRKGSFPDLLPLAVKSINNR